jgi:hypothetical protein
VEFSARLDHVDRARLDHVDLHSAIENDYPFAIQAGRDKHGEQVALPVAQDIGVCHDDGFVRPDRNPLKRDFD